MTWLKKNLFLVAGGSAALGLLGVAIFFLLTNKQAVDEVTTQLTAQTDDLKKLAIRDPYPNQENIDAAKTEQKKVGAFLQETRRFFVPAANFTTMDSEGFKTLLETTISEMVRDAEKSGVGLPNAPARYDFTFKHQRTSVVFAPETLAPLATQVAEIKAICDVLFDARVQMLVGLRRTPVAKEDEEATDYLFGRKPATNAVTGAVAVPYEISFQGFSGELAAVLEGFYRSSNCFVVKNIDVQTNITQTATEAAPSSFLPYYPSVVSPAPTPQLTPSEMMRMRYGGMGGRYGMRPPLGPPPPPVAPAPGVFTPRPRRGPETILDERPLKITMYVEAVRLIERARSKAGK